MRPAQQVDLSACCDLLRQLFSIEADFAFDADKAARGLALLLNAPEHLLLVAERAQQVCGMVSVQRLISTAEGGPVGLVEDMVVANEHRGRGIGRRLLTAAEAWARDQGLTRLQLLADRDNASALAFYHRQGWQTTALVAWRRPLLISNVQAHGMTSH